MRLIDADALLEELTKLPNIYLDSELIVYKKAVVQKITNAPTVKREGWVSVPIDHDADMNRFYIPLPAGWEVQTKGSGSSFRICDTKTHERVHVLDERLQPVIEQMAREIHNACNLDSIRLDWLQVNFDSALTRENIDKAMIQAAPTLNEKG